METIMLSLSRHFRSQRCRRGLTRLQAAFTLVEIVIALAVLGTMASGVYIGFNAINAYAVSSRLYSEALTAAQNHIDFVLSREPFDISAAYISGSFNSTLNKIPLELMTVAELDALSPQPLTSPPPTTNQYYPYYRIASGVDAGKLAKEAFIYRDPVTGLVVVTGTLISTVSDSAMTMNFVNATATNLNTRTATVAVTYTFRNRPYTVAMDTLRTADQ
jgi:prepilin-type N-terminal cleavage/methylation domain-containing protein